MNIEMIYYVTYIPCVFHIVCTDFIDCTFFAHIVISKQIAFLAHIGLIHCFYLLLGKRIWLAWIALL